MNLNKISLKDINKSSPNMYVRDVEPFYAYEDNKKTDRIGGMTYTGTLWYKHTEVKVKVYDEVTPRVSQQMLDNAPNGMVEATITGFIGRAYANNRGAVELTATATTISPIQESAPTPQTKS